MEQNIAIVAQARMGSSRLPGKVMKKIDDENPLLYYVMNQLKRCKLGQKLIIATTNFEQDDIIESYVKKHGIICFRGSANDCLDRYYKCAKHFKLSIIIRVTCDNPLIDPVLVDKMLDFFLTRKIDYLTNCKPRTFPQGTEVEIFSFESLEKAWKNAVKNSEREHVTPYFYNNPSGFKILNFFNSADQSGFRWTVDRKEDLELVKRIISKIKKDPILTEDIVDLLKKEPQMLKINKNHVIDEGYLKSLKIEDIHNRK